MKNNANLTQSCLTKCGGWEQNDRKVELIVDYGDRLGHKDTGKIRIGFQNINGIKGPINAANEIFDVIEDKEVDIMGLAETNINWTEKKRQ